MLVTQPINLDIQYKHRKRLGVSDYVPSERLYEERQRVLRKRLASQGWVWNFEAAFVIHGSLMEIQRRISRQMSLAFVDFIPIADPHPEILADGVHLTNEGNELFGRGHLPGIFFPGGGVGSYSCTILSG